MTRNPTTVKRWLLVPLAIGCLVAAVIAVTAQPAGTISIPVLTCHAIIDMAEADGTLDGGGDFDACVEESESQDPQIQLEIAEAIFDA